MLHFLRASVLYVCIQYVVEINVNNFTDLITHYFMCLRLGNLHILIKNNPYTLITIFDSLYNMYSNSRTLSVSGDRRITGFPTCFTKNSAINENFDFHPRVRQICSGERLGNVGLKICKMIVIGDVAVGKTCLINRCLVFNFS